MKKITEIDRNFSVEKHPDFGETAFYDCEKEPFSVYGVFREGKQFRRMPEAIAKNVNDGVHSLHTCTAGGRVRFKAGGDSVVIRVQLDDPLKMPHFPLTGSIGFDLYEFNGEKREYLGTFIPPFDVKKGYESRICFEDKGERELMINFPLYCGVKKLEIGLKPDVVPKKASDYRHEKPVVFYGSSITQGGCASRAGCSYQAMLSAGFDFDYINLGFSGSAKGEQVIADYIAGLDMGVFVLDYDHNAPTAEHLLATHLPFYQTIRKAHPKLPVILLSRPKYHLTKDEETRRDIVKATYEKAKADGDPVWFLDGPALMSGAPEEGTVDNSHPTDSGFASMTAALAPVFAEIYREP